MNPCITLGAVVGALAASHCAAAPLTTGGGSNPLVHCVPLIVVQTAMYNIPPYLPEPQCIHPKRSEGFFFLKRPFRAPSARDESAAFGQGRRRGGRRRAQGAVPKSEE